MASEIEDLGRAAYAPVLARMRALRDQVAAGAPGRILLVEHDPVYTAGRATPPSELGPHVVEIERGGRITFHGPGQLVVYPIVRLPKQDLRDWLRRLEAFGIAVCADFGLQATAAANGTGVFVGRHKVASIGVAVKQWVNLHGIAINVAMDPADWQRVRPCGLDPAIVSDLSTVGSRTIGLDAVKASARRLVFLLTDPEHAL